eukprot:GHVQ01024299.1.p1 GENE.GHVQ01024299.1~~GHVQ01024299.1.p1  ORF type:complete len:952 (+),score=177.81 GHVQ01024299.1:89-2944(+)
MDMVKLEEDEKLGDEEVAAAEEDEGPEVFDIRGEDEVKEIVDADELIPNEMEAGEVGGHRDGNVDMSDPAPLPSNVLKMKVCDEDAAFILGKNGKTKVKIARVSRARLELHDEKSTEEGGKKEGLELTITGGDAEKERAQLYIRLIMKQRVGPVTIDFDTARDDLTIMRIPHESVGYVTGAQGCVLRKIEDEWGTLMFFVGGDSEGKKHIDTGMDQDGRKLEQLLIFGNERNRRGTELKIMSAVEQKCPNFFTSGVEECKSDDEVFGTDIMFISKEDFSYALGKEGRTRKKLAKASGCILEYVGKIAYMSGTKAERNRVKEYLGWLIQQRLHVITVDTANRTDVTVLNIPTEYVAYVTGRQGSGLRDLESRTGTFCFFEGGEPAIKQDEASGPAPPQKTHKSASGIERLYIFGVDHSGRENARRLVQASIEQRDFRSSAMASRPMRGGGDYGMHPEGRHDRSRSRDRFMSRRGMLGEGPDGGTPLLQDYRFGGRMGMGGHMYPPPVRPVMLPYRHNNRMEVPRVVRTPRTVPLGVMRVMEGNKYGGGGGGGNGRIMNGRGDCDRRGPPQHYESANAPPRYDERRRSPSPPRYLRAAPVIVPQNSNGMDYRIAQGGYDVYGRRGMMEDREVVDRGEYSYRGGDREYPGGDRVERDWGMESRREASRDYLRGDAHRGDVPRGDFPRGDMPRGDAPRGDVPRGDLPRGDVPRGDVPRGDVARGDLPRGDLPRGDIPRGDISRGDVPRGDVPRAGRSPSIGEGSQISIPQQRRTRGDGVRRGSDELGRIGSRGMKEDRRDYSVERSRTHRHRRERQSSDRRRGQYEEEEMEEEERKSVGREGRYTSRRHGSGGDRRRVREEEIERRYGRGGGRAEEPLYDKRREEEELGGGDSRSKRYNKRDRGGGGESSGGEESPAMDVYNDKRRRRGIDEVDMDDERSNRRYGRRDEDKIGRY